MNWVRLFPSGHHICTAACNTWNTRTIHSAAVTSRHDAHTTVSCSASVLHWFHGVYLQPTMNNCNEQTEWDATSQQQSAHHWRCPLLTFTWCSTIIQVEPINSAASSAAAAVSFMTRPTTSCLHYCSDKDHQTPFLGGPNTHITNPRLLSATILKK